MPRGLKRYQQAGGLHFITFNCGVPHSRPSLGLEWGFSFVQPKPWGQTNLGWRGLVAAPGLWPWSSSLPAYAYQERGLVRVNELGVLKMKVLQPTVFPH
jgi:hypothetical protein